MTKKFYFSFRKFVMNEKILIQFDYDLNDIRIISIIYRSSDRKEFPLYDRLILRSFRKERKLRLKEEKLAKKLTKTDIKSNETKSEDSNEEIQSNKCIDKEESAMRTVLNRSEQMQESRRQFAQKFYENNEKYRKIYDRIVEIYAKELKTDLEKLANNNKSISLIGKWTPSNGRHFDKYLSISRSIAVELCKLLQKNEIIENPRLVLEFYQKQVCAPLRKFLKIPEVYMSANEWNQIDYNRVASKCMQKNKTAFIKHDMQRFEAFVSSKKTIAGATLKPIELVERGLKLIHGTLVEGEELENEVLEKEVLEKQWLSLCEDIKKKGISV